MKLNIEQRKIIESKPSGQLLVRGVAGSGKTTVAVHRIPILINHYCPAKEDKVLMVTYNKSLVNYVKYIYEEIKKHNKEQNIQIDFYQSDIEDKTKISTIDSLMFRYFVEYKKEKNANEIRVAKPQEQQNALVNAIIKLKEKYPDIKLLDTKNLMFLKEEITWIKSCNYMDIESYQTIDRLGRTVTNNSDGPQKLRKNSRVREAIFETMLEYRKNLINDNLVDFQDMALIALSQARKQVYEKYTHIIIDETQDLTRVQLEFIKKLYMDKDYSSLLFVSDNAQSIYPQAWLVKGRSFASIGFDMTGKSNSLSKNYRTTAQIAQAAYSLIEKDKNIVEDDNFVKPSLIDKQGVYPVYKGFINKDKEAEFIINTIKNELVGNYDYKDIAIVAKMRNQLEEIKSYLAKVNIPFKEIVSNEEMDFSENSIKLLTMHSIKGLEFKVVMIIGLNNKCIPLKNIANEFEDDEIIESRDRKLLYVGMTRATEKLFLTSDASPSKFIKDIDYRFLRINSKSKFRRFHRIDIENYEFKNKVDVYSNEEITRQWIIDELCNVYGYPMDLIDIEYKVNIGSKQCLVDIVVYIYGENGKIPYIFIETKRWGVGIENAIPQLTSYMSNNINVRYGIASDGNELKIINNKFEEIDDIPLFNINMMPSSLEMFDYIDLKHKKRYEFLRDLGNDKDIIVDDSDIYNEVVGVPVFSEIAAGVPILIGDGVQDKFYLCDDWIRDKDNSFILKVKGDSMIDADIDDGDLVVIRQQSSANNGEIVAVDVGGSATLKKLMVMGSNVLLISENENYEPIMLDRDQVRIIGIAVGVIKHKNVSKCC